MACQIVPSTVLGAPTVLVAIATRRPPPGVGDTIVRLLRRLTGTDLSQWDIPRPSAALSRQFAQRDVVPITHPDLVPQVKAGRIEVVGPVSRFEDSHVVLGNGERIRPDAVIAATGCDRALAPLVGDLRLVPMATVRASTDATLIRAPRGSTSSVSQIR